MGGFVWYVCYGSNLLYERFLCYIEGGICRYNRGSYTGCKDKTPPKSTRAAILPYEIYFGKESKSWGGGGVAFLDAEKPSVVLGRMYLVSEEQFEDIRTQEGRWYNRTLEFECDQIKDCPIKSFTHDTRCKENPPSLTYRGVIQSGMKEMLEDDGIFQSPVAILRGC